MKKPSIVAPWWSYSKAVVASYYWADEVYVWVPYTSLRMRQNKISDFDLLKKTIDAIHSYWSKALLTMNIFPRNSDIKIFESVVEKISDSWADWIIFSDPWTFNILKKYFSDIPFHLSTQTSTLNYSAVKFWYDLWVKRIVSARELHINEIKEIKKHVPWMEIEVFVHWAMCMAYSWRCLLGDYLSWRPWNKWECSHACRFKYKVWLEEEKRPWKLMQLDYDEDWSYIMSSKDLCTIDYLQEIIPYVDALKIEWRSKSEFYVWSVVKAYKHVRDSILNWVDINEDIKNLVEIIPHREYWSGFLLNTLKDFPEKEDETKKCVTTTTLWSAWPLFARVYFWLIEPDYILVNWDKYFKFIPKENIINWIVLNYMKSDNIWKIKIIDILDQNQKQIEKATCNHKYVYIKTNIDLWWREIIYKL